ncbi:hypothetical protein PsorP6_009913 [Peronosclerospora sorghi]|uniref:Uncharacterized protein n=1 Tax=Peronosclerospora sorghi TaxID=230839 RepID=A0ACC0VZI9_9STRA|nr:hypothetical protein PsorP6_009913 [Peronosclerospora sorghi]
MDLEKEFEARIAQAKEAARLASIAAAARTSKEVKAPSSSSGLSSSGSSLSFHPTRSLVSASCATFSAPFPSGSVPADVKTRIDRLVDFVARNGDVFEETAKERERENPDFDFLKPGGPYSDYYQWKKQQMCTNTVPLSTSSEIMEPLPPPRSPFPSSYVGLPVRPDPLGEMAVGAMANVCKYARKRGVQSYAPIPREVFATVGTLPPVEPARLEIRLSEFYREEARSSERLASD